MMVIIMISEAKGGLAYEALKGGEGEGVLIILKGGKIGWVERDSSTTKKFFLTFNLFLTI